MSLYVSRQKTWFFPTHLDGWLTGLSCLGVLATWVLAFWKLPGFAESPDALISLHYNVYLGVDEVARWQWGLIVPGVATFVFFVGIFLAKNEQVIRLVLARIIRAVSLAVSAAALTAVFFMLVANV